MEDIPLFVHRFLDTFKQENGRPDLVLAPEVVDMLTRCRWEGNVREIRNLIESLVVLCPPDKPVIGLDDLPESYRSPAATPAAEPAGPARTMGEIEREAILRTLRETGGNRTRAAEILGIGLRTLQRKLREYDQVGGED